jgi:lysylphosphatidylglycerol synthetase-like protein (DUF2156 family)
LFQFALALGAPWGRYAMGGRYPGKYPRKMRMLALFQILILIFFNLIILVKVGMIFEGLYSDSKVAIWFVVGFFVLGTFMHIMTKSKWERILWLPVNIILLISSLYLALH